MGPPSIARTALETAPKMIDMKKPRWQFALLAVLLVVSAVLCLCLPVYIWIKEKNLRRVVGDVGGKVTHSESMFGGTVNAVRGISFESCRGVDQLLERLSSYQYITSLNLANSDLNDVSLLHVQQLPNLNSLDISRTNISDRGIGQLDQLNGLLSLRLKEMAIDDKALSRFLRQNRQLRFLDLGGTRIGKTTIEALHELTFLERLELSGSGVNDENVTLIGGSKNLRHMRLDNNNLTNAGISKLNDLPMLQHLSLIGTSVDWEGVNRVKEALPSLEDVELGSN